MLKENPEYAELVDVIVAQGLDGKAFDRKKLGEINELAGEKEIAVSGLNNWEATSKSDKDKKDKTKEANPYKDKNTNKKGDKAAKDAKDAKKKKNPAEKAKGKNAIAPIGQALKTGFDTVISNQAVPRLVSTAGVATAALTALTGAAGAEAMKDLDSDPLTYAFDPKLKGYDK